MTRLETPFGFRSTTGDVLRGVDLSGQTALVTGGNAGIGYETARALASAGAAVVIGARRDAAGRDAFGQHPYEHLTDEKTSQLNSIDGHLCPVQHARVRGMNEGSLWRVAVFGWYSN